MSSLGTRHTHGADTYSVKILIHIKKFKRTNEDLGIWWCMPVILILGWWKQEHQESKTILAYSVTLRLSLAT